MRQLEAYKFPYNIAELMGIVERAAQQVGRVGCPQTRGSEARQRAVCTPATSAHVLWRAPPPHPPTRRTSQATAQGQIGEEVFWFAKQSEERLRVDLLRSLPMLHRFVRSDWWPERINFGFTVYAFAVAVAVLFVAPQDRRARGTKGHCMPQHQVLAEHSRRETPCPLPPIRPSLAHLVCREHNFVLNIFWCDWWPLVFISYPFLGRIWCAVCPFMIYGEVVQRWRVRCAHKGGWVSVMRFTTPQDHFAPPPPPSPPLAPPSRSRGAQLLKWPREQMEAWGPWFLFTLFAGGSEAGERRARALAPTLLPPEHAAAPPPPPLCLPLLLRLPRHLGVGGGVGFAEHRLPFLLAPAHHHSRRGNMQLYL